MSGVESQGNGGWRSLRRGSPAHAYGAGVDVYGTVVKSRKRGLFPHITLRQENGEPVTISFQKSHHGQITVEGA